MIRLVFLKKDRSFFLLQFLVLETVHFSNIHRPHFNDDENEKTEEQGEWRAARLAQSVPHLLFAFQHHLGRALWPVCEEGQCRNDDHRHEDDQIPPTNVLRMRSSVMTCNVDFV